MAINPYKYFKLKMHDLNTLEFEMSYYKGYDYIDIDQYATLQLRVKQLKEEIQAILDELSRKIDIEKPLEECMR